MGSVSPSLYIGTSHCHMTRVSSPITTIFPSAIFQVTPYESSKAIVEDTLIFAL
jgi:hypothetical protein